MNISKKKIELVLSLEKQKLRVDIFKIHPSS